MNTLNNDNKHPAPAAGFEKTCLQAWNDMFHKCRPTIEYSTYRYIWNQCIERLGLTTDEEINRADAAAPVAQGFVAATPSTIKAELATSPSGLVIELKKITTWMNDLPIPTDGALAQMMRLQRVIDAMLSYTPRPRVTVDRELLIRAAFEIQHSVRTGDINLNIVTDLNAAIDPDPRDPDQAGPRQIGTFQTEPCLSSTRALEKETADARALPVAAETSLIWPKVMSPDLKQVLGYPNFWCGPYAAIYRAAGHDIAKRAEDEQAFILHRFACAAIEHGENWSDVIEDELMKLRAVLGEKA